MHFRTLLACLIFVALGGCKKDAPPVADVPAPLPAAPAALAAAPAGEVTFAVMAPVVGARFSEVSTTEMALELNVEAAGQKVATKMTSAESAKYTVEILAVEADLPTKAKLVYAEKKTIDSEDGKAKEAAPSPVVGKTYVISQAGEELTVTAEKGGKVSTEERDIVIDDCDFIGKPDPLRAAFPKRAIKIGEEVPELKEALRAVIADGAASGSATEPKISNVAIKLKEARADVGVFEITMTMAMVEGPMAMTIDLKGTIDVRKSDTELVNLKLAGPITVAPSDSPQTQGMKMTGKGTMAMGMSQKPL